MAKRTFKLDSGFDLSITLEIDTEILTPKWAGEISRFWTSKDEVLAASDDDEYQAVARYAATRLWGLMLENYTERGALMELHEQEGWCIPTETLGIKILDHDLPVLDSAELEVEELTEATLNA